MLARRAIATVTTTRVASCLLGAALIAAPVAPRAQGLDGIEIGRISELDLEAVRLIIDQSDDVGMPEPSQVLPLTLEGAVKTALENNLGLQIVAIEVGQSGLEIKAAKSKFHPVGALIGDATGTKRNETNPGLNDQSSDTQQLRALVRQAVPTGGDLSLGVGYGREFTDEVVALNTVGGQAFTNQQNTSQIAGLGIEIRQPLLRGGRTYVARQKILDAEYDNEASRAELRGRMLLVTAETKAAYYAAIGAARQVEVIEQAIARDDALIRASTALFDAGRVSKVDLFSAEISQSNDQARLATAKADLEIAQNQLRQVIGLPIDVRIEVVESTIPFRPIRITLDQWVARAMDSRPELTRLQSQLDKVELAVKVAKNATLPTLDVSGGFQPGFDWKSYNYNAGLNLEYQIGNVGPRSKLSQARLERDKLRHDIARARRDIELEVREIEIRLRENVLRLRNLLTAVASAREKGKIARGRFEMGLANNLDITNADEELIRSESLLLQALVDYATNIARLEAQIGGDL